MAEAMVASFRVPDAGLAIAAQLCDDNDANS
jgi:hypothetical protein